MRRVLADQFTPVPLHLAALSLLTLSSLVYKPRDWPGLPSHPDLPLRGGVSAPALQATPGQALSRAEPC